MFRESHGKKSLGGQDSVFLSDQRVTNFLKELMHVFTKSHTSFRSAERGMNSVIARPFLAKQVCVVQSFRPTKEEDADFESR